MRLTTRKITAVIITLFVSSLLSGCTDWKAEYDNLYVENRNLEGQIEREKQRNQEYINRISEDSQTIKDLQNQIQVSKKTPGQVTGFDGFDVALNASEGTITVTLSSSILFDSGQAGLKKASSDELNSIYSVLRSKYANRQIDVVGHTDSDPIQKSDWKDNWELSAERALTVTRYIIGKGLPEKQIRAIGCGESRPVVPNTSAANKAKNRRVEIVVHMR
jgi:chemotaxis protein MotB